MERWEDQMQNRAQFWRCAAHDMAATALTDMESQLRAGLGAVLLVARILVAKAGDVMTITRTYCYVLYIFTLITFVLLKLVLALVPFVDCLPFALSYFPH